MTSVSVISYYRNFLKAHEDGKIHVFPGEYSGNLELIFFSGGVDGPHDALSVLHQVLKACIL